MLTKLETKYFLYLGQLYFYHVLTLEDLKIPAFECAVSHKGKVYNLLITQVSLNNEHEVFEVKCNGAIKQVITLRPHYRLVYKTNSDFGVNPAPGTKVKDWEGLKKVGEAIKEMIAFYEAPLNIASHNYFPPNWME